MEIFVPVGVVFVSFSPLNVYIPSNNKIFNTLNAIDKASLHRTTRAEICFMKQR
jgi:hypothetical protein